MSSPRKLTLLNKFKIAIGDLPPEILLEIFHFVISAARYAGKTESAFSLYPQEVISHVCMSWRHWILGDPSFWTSISYAKQTDLRWIPHWLLRSKGLPLRLSIFIENETNHTPTDTSNLVLALSACTHQLRQLAIRNYNAPEAYVSHHGRLPPILTPTPLMEILLGLVDTCPSPMGLLELQYHNAPRHTDLIFQTNPDEDAKIFLSLSSFLSNVQVLDISGNSFTLDWPIRNLRELVLSNSFTGLAPTANQYWEFLRNSPALTVLRLHLIHLEDVPECPVPIIHLPALQHISYSTDHRTAQVLLGPIRAPSLRALVLLLNQALTNLGNIGDLSTFLDLNHTEQVKTTISCRRYKGKALTLRPWRLPGIFNHMPNLTHLHLIRTPWLVSQKILSTLAQPQSRLSVLIIQDGRFPAPELREFLIHFARYENELLLGPNTEVADSDMGPVGCEDVRTQIVGWLEELRSETGISRDGFLVTSFES